MIIFSGWKGSGDGGTLNLDGGNTGHFDLIEKKKSKTLIARSRRTIFAQQ
jgi:hypothetical protein